MIYEPNKQNRAPEGAIAALLICAGVCFGFAAVPRMAGRGFLQLAALVFFCAMIFILVRYQFTRVRYLVRARGHAEEDDSDRETGAEDASAAAAAGDAPRGTLGRPPEKLEFVVECAQGNRTMIAECVLPLGKLTACHPLPEDRRERRNLLRQYKKAKSYRYLRNMVGAHQAMLVFTDTEYGDVRVTIEPSEQLEGYLSAVARYNREK